MEDKELNHQKNIFQDCNINFLIGSGLSNPFFGTLGNIETWLEELEDLKSKKSINDDDYLLVKATLYKTYFDVAMKGNIEVHSAKITSDEYEVKEITSQEKLNNTYKAYKDFFKTLNHILYERRSNTVNKQINLFTTNIDIFNEKLLEDLDLQYNDGFNGIFNKKFSLSNFKKSFYQKSLHYDNISEIPVFNLLKIHGSVTWEMQNGNINFSNLNIVEDVNHEISKLSLIDIKKLNDNKWKSDNRNLNIKEIVDEIDKTDPKPNVDDFINSYEKLQIVNPTKDKFRDTTFNKNYYELLRLFANELEKENTVLYVMGFSMADEHIREITIRAIKSNPTLKIFLVSYTKSADDIIANFLDDLVDIKSFPNVEFICPEDGFNMRKFNEHLLFPLKDSIVEYNKTNS
ncbi:SIR2 family protein [Flavobacteriaceae bacterium F89]|uniref:SIR2 family protein n=1 Tax=Cerina litoralis TaxID=2874477 RepID=A0AAE3ER71_9FLAO|nr:SIR2 family protein [Cerina litoralis]MCG2459473.1 SIR2 family protein [Cerina litoralis]